MKKKIKKLFSLTLLIGSLFLLTACKPSPEGTWTQSESGNDYEVTVRFVVEKKKATMYLNTTYTEEGFFSSKPVNISGKLFQADIDKSKQTFKITKGASSDELKSISIGANMDQAVGETVHYKISKDKKTMTFKDFKLKKEE